jgi:hypothetical protein
VFTEFGDQRSTSSALGGTGCDLLEADAHAAHVVEQGLAYCHAVVVGIVRQVPMLDVLRRDVLGEDKRGALGGGSFSIASSRLATLKTTLYTPSPRDSRNSFADATSVPSG